MRFPLRSQVSSFLTAPSSSLSWWWSPQWRARALGLAPRWARGTTIWRGIAPREADPPARPAYSAAAQDPLVAHEPQRQAHGCGPERTLLPQRGHAGECGRWGSRDDRWRARPRSEDEPLGGEEGERGEHVMRDLVVAWLSALQPLSSSCGRGRKGTHGSCGLLAVTFFRAFLLIQGAERSLSAVVPLPVAACSRTPSSRGSSRSSTRSARSRCRDLWST